MMTITTKVLQRITFLFTLVIFLVEITAWQEAIASTVMFTGEYTYVAGDADSKLTSRTIAMEQVKRLLLEELSTYLVSNTEVKDATLTKDEIATYTAGAVMMVIIEESWNGVRYHMKAKMTADADEVAKSVAAMAKNANEAKKAEPAQVVSGDTNDGLSPTVSSLTVGQSGDKAVATYDLVGVEGKKEADVTVAIIIDGVRHTADSLKLSGDFGKGVKVGPGKKIVWDATADLPSDFDGEFSWDVQAVSASAPVKKAKKAKKAKPSADSDENVDLSAH